MDVMAFRVWNFMGFEDSGWIELPPIGLLFGRNSTGKSAILKALRMLRQSLERSPSSGPLVLYSESGVDLGSYKDMIHSHEESLDVGFGFKCRLDPNLLIDFKSKEERLKAKIAGESPISDQESWATIKLEYGLRGGTQDIILKQFVINVPWSVTEGGDDSRVFFAEWLDEVYGWHFDTDVLNEHKSDVFGPIWSVAEVRLSDRGFLPILWGLPKEYDEQAQDLFRVRNLLASFSLAIESFLESVIYLGPVRSEPQRFYYLPQSSLYRAGGHGLSSLYDFLTLWGSEQWKHRLEQVNEQLKGMKVQAELGIRSLKSGKGKVQVINGDIEERKLRQERLTRLLQMLDTRELQELCLFFKIDYAALPGGEPEDKAGELVEYLERHDRLHELVLGRESNEPVFEVVLQELDQDGARANLCDVGSGVSQLLPMILECVLAEDGATIVIEQPELHLHPSAQAELGDILIRTAKRGVRFLVETHSENLLLRLRRRLAQTSGNILEDAGLSLEVNDFSAYFVDRQQGASSVEALRFDEWGDYISRPTGFGDFFGQDFEELVKMKRAHSSRAKGT